MRIRGLDELFKQLHDIERKEAILIARAGVRAGLAVLTQAIRDGIPVESGDYKRAETSKMFNRGLYVGGLVGADVDLLQADVKDDGKKHPSNIDYLTEFGHVMADGTFVPPTGRMRATAAAIMPFVEIIVGDRIAAGIEKIGGW